MTAKTLKDLAALLLVLALTWIAYQLALVVVAGAVAIVVWKLTASLYWSLGGALGAYFLLRLAIETLDLLDAWRGARCPNCRQRVLTSLPAKCVECGGAAKRRR